MTICQSPPTRNYNHEIVSHYAINRLLEERRLWRQYHPPGFIAKPVKNPDGTLNLFVWDCYIPGAANTLWEGSRYHMQMTFDNDYPSSPPKCKFDPPLHHPYIFPDGLVCTPLLDKDKNWHPSITVRYILNSIQQLLNHPEARVPERAPGRILTTRDQQEYRQAM